MPMQLLFVVITMNCDSAVGVHTGYAMQNVQVEMFAQNLCTGHPREQDRGVCW